MLGDVHLQDQSLSNKKLVSKTIQNNIELIPAKFKDTGHTSKIFSKDDKNSTLRKKNKELRW